MVPTTWKNQQNPKRYNDHWIWNVSKQLVSYEYWSVPIQKIFTLQLIFPPASVGDFHADDSNPSFQPVIETVWIRRRTDISALIFRTTSQENHLSK